MPTIYVDDEVFAFLQEKATPLVDDPNNLLRRLFSLAPKRAHAPEPDMPGLLLPLLKEGHLKAGDELVWNRPRKKTAYRAMVTAGGCLKLSDGHIETHPSTACSHVVGGGSFNGWREWRTTGGIRIGDLRE